MTKSETTNLQGPAGGEIANASVEIEATPSLAAARLADAAGLAAPTLDDLCEAEVAWAQAAFGTAEIIAAQEQFFAEKGKVFPDDAFYDARMSYFFDWFLFERNASRQGATPHTLFCAALVESGLKLSEPAGVVLDGLGSFRHSFFQILKLQDTSLVVQDLLQPAKLTVRPKGKETYRGLERKVIFQGFLFQLGDVNHISNGIVLHQQRVTSVIKKQLKIAQKSQNFSAQTELSRLASVQMRQLRHRHVDPKLIYAKAPAAAGKTAKG